MEKLVNPVIRKITFPVQLSALEVKYVTEIHAESNGDIHMINIVHSRDDKAIF